MEEKISKYLLRSICLFVGVFIVSESLWHVVMKRKMIGLISRRIQF